MGIRKQVKIIFDYLKYKTVVAINIFRSDEVYVTKKIHGNLMSINVKDPGIAKELLTTATHEPRTTDLIKSILKPGMKIIELGANVGYYALIEAQLIGQSGHIYAFEPVPNNYNNLLKNIDINKYSNVSCFKKAIAEKRGISTFTTTTASNWGSMVDYNSENCSSWVKDRSSKISVDSFEVETISIDEFLMENNITKLNLIRMDIEGFEINAIKGMKQTIKNMNSPFYILMEVHNNVFKDSYKSLSPTFRFLENENMVPKKIICKSKEFDAPVDHDWVKLLLTENTIGVNHILLEKRI